MDLMIKEARMEYGLTQKDLSEILPWDIIEVGLSKKSLRRENEKALPLSE